MADFLIWGDCSRGQLDIPESVVVLPVGATEQHGLHLPTGTDAFLAAEIAREASAAAAPRMSRDVLLAPCLPFGASQHHLRYGGTLAMSVRTLLSVVEDLIDSLESQGARRLLIINGHGGNRGALAAAAASVDARDGMVVAAFDYWELGHFAPPAHAGPVEASLMMAAAPGTVALERHEPGGSVTLPAALRSHIHGGWIWRTTGGVTADPASATAQEGASRRRDAVAGAAEVIVALGSMKLPDHQAVL